MPYPPHKGQYRPLFAFLLATLAVGAAASLARGPDSASWYGALLKPDFAPPFWLFAPAATAFYILMAVAAWRVWRITGLHHGAIRLYAAQLALSLAWTVGFFGLHALVLAAATIALLLILAVATALFFGRRDRIAGFLFMPWIAWTAFLAALNAALLLAA